MGWLQRRLGFSFCDPPVTIGFRGNVDQLRGACGEAVSGNVRIGQCKLTMMQGRYVKAHIIPEALTETSWKGQPLTQKGRNGRHIRRWTSWYDNRLVTDNGEAILAKYDDWAINFFRQKRLIWSSWGRMVQLESPDHVWFPGPQVGIRKLEGIDCKCLRLFFLSLLWRAAATSLFEFKSVSMPACELAQLREMVLHGQVEPYHFYPVTLTQLVTRNIPHNWSAGRLIKRQPMVDPSVLIRLTQTPARCRVRPRAGIKAGIGRRLNPARDAEQRAERVERVETPVEAERELIEVGL